MNQYTHTDDQSGTCPLPPTPTESFTYDADGNLTGDADYTYEWDAENRLVAVVPRVPNYVRRKYTFVYDYMGRRVRRTAQIYTGSAWVELPVDGDQKLVYDRWNVIQVLDANNGDAVVRTYTWGLDLSGLSGDGSVEGVHGAGGIGGLLAVEVPQATGESRKYGYLYDGNGNVVQLVAYQNASETATLATHYEYDAYGRTAYAVNYDDGSAAGANPFRFSTKWLEDQTSANGFLYYFGYRYYSPRLGRWSSRDPIEENGGLNLRMFAMNAPGLNIDHLGLASCKVDCYSLEQPRLAAIGQKMAQECGGVVGQIGTDWAVCLAACAPAWKFGPKAYAACWFGCGVVATLAELAEWYACTGLYQELASSVHAGYKNCYNSQKLKCDRYLIGRGQCDDKVCCEKLTGYKVNPNTDPRYK